jgi:hypothetical protein
MSELRLVLLGAPRTKKNHGSVKMVGKKRVHVPSAAYMTWRNAVVQQIPARTRVPDQPYNCRALIYRETLTGDAVGYYQAIADMLQEAGVVSDDKWIEAWDGSRLLKDAHRPRVELVLTPMTGDDR